ncbi:hypothetical protein M231_06546 [Tremella mesenterica]|uniref:Uncharacterized protein n=1 Tax=Tremella mesenterica TaxID=5217 RepID=A0A4Q1BBL6_TREME|nr:uncharacterized protein TREMEDRAFT_58816 [Tremella mesenterica DSM 1558]EIW72646.1 hypothetical protein TREMEDRAFT_58816 [Tremella mesenterica DSM 1558]RXK36202.1 hypothetical protein M231_06546 [Tremella mesenterica]
MPSTKRESSSSPNDPSTPSPKPKKIKSSPSSSTTPKKEKTSGSRGEFGKLTDAMRAELLDEVIAHGAKSVNLEEIAQRFGVKKSQLIDQLKPNRTNIRSKAVKAIASGA